MSHLSHVRSLERCCKRKDPCIIRVVGTQGPQGPSGPTELHFSEGFSLPSETDVRFIGQGTASPTGLDVAYIVCNELPITTFRVAVTGVVSDMTVTVTFELFRATCSAMSPGQIGLVSGFSPVPGFTTTVIGSSNAAGFCRFIVVPEQILNAGDMVAVRVTPSFPALFKASASIC